MTTHNDVNKHDTSTIQLSKAQMPLIQNTHDLSEHRNSPGHQSRLRQLRVRRVCSLSQRLSAQTQSLYAHSNHHNIQYIDTSCNHDRLLSGHNIPHRGYRKHFITQCELTARFRQCYNPLTCIELTQNNQHHSNKLQYSSRNVDKNHSHYLYTV